MKTKKRFSKLTAWVLTLAMMMTFIPSITIGVNAADNTTTEKNITLGASALKGGQQSNIYFGRYQQSSLGSEQPTTGTEGNDWIKSDTAKYNGQGAYYKKDPIKWRVLSNADGKAFLLSDKNLDVVRYHEDKEAVTWETSTIRSWLNGYGATSNQNSVDYSKDNFINTAFGAAEKGVIADTIVVNDDNPKSNTAGGNNTTDKVFLLSIAEAQNTAYGFTNYASSTDTRKALNTAYVYGGGKNGTSGMDGVGESDYWWFRSPGDETRRAAYVLAYGGLAVNGYPVNSDGIAVRPAFNLNLSSVLFTSAAKGGKTISTGAVSKNVDLSTLTDNDGYKLTLLDSNRDFAVSDTAAKTVKTGDTLSLEYTGATTGTNEYISAMLVDGNNEILYYGTLASVTSDNGTVEITVPLDIAAGTYTLKLFNEHINGDFKTDYASDFEDIALTVEVPVPEAKWGASKDNLTNEGILANAIAAAAADNNIKYILLSSDVTVSEEFLISAGVFTIDLNGYTVTNTSASGGENRPITFDIEQTGDTYQKELKVTFTDSSTDGTGKVVSTNSAAIFANAYALGNGIEVILEKGKYEGYTFGLTVNTANSNVTVQPDVNISSKSSIGSAIALNGGVLKMNGGILIGNKADFDFGARTAADATLDLSDYSTPDNMTIVASRAMPISQVKLPADYGIFNSDTPYSADDTVEKNTIVTIKSTKKYTVMFNSNGGSSIDEQVITNGNTVTEPTAPTKAEYIFNGWYKEESLTNKWNFENDTVSADITLYAKWLEKESVSITETPQTVSYDRTTKAFEIKGTSLLGFTVSYKRGSETVTNPTNAGSYDVIITRAEDDTYKGYSKTIADGLVIEKANAVITVDTAPITITYGDGLTLPTATTTFGSVTKDKTEADLKDVGEYTVTYTVEGTGNYNGDTKTVNVEVNPLPVNITWQNTENLVYDGNEITVTAEVSNAVPGDIVNLTVTGNKETNVGNYTAKVTALDNDNYTLEGVTTTKDWSILQSGTEFAVKKVLNGATETDSFTYGDTIIVKIKPQATGTAPTTMMLMSVTPPTENQMALYIGDTQVSEAVAADGDGYYTMTIDTTTVGLVYGEITLTAKYVGNANMAGNAENVRLTLQKADATLGNAPIAKTDLIYNSAEQTLIDAGSEFTGGTLMYKLNDGEYSAELPKATGAGTYTVYYKVFGDNNHNDTAEQPITVTIAEKPINPAIELTAPVANATPQTTIETDEYTASVVWSPEVTDKFAYSTAYTATITLTPKTNYTVTGITENGYTVNGTESVTNTADSGNITVVYAETGRRPSSGGGTIRYTVKFETNGGSTIANKTVTRNSKLAEPTAPTKDGYTFDGWYTDKELTKVYDFDTKVTKAITLYAKWTEDKEDDTDNKTDDKTDTPDAPVWENPFEDVKADDWYYKDVEYAVKNGLFNGTTDTTFAPNGIITRAMMVTVLYRAEGEPTVTGTATFEDVDSNAYYAKAVVWGQQNGIIKGYSETEFAPDQNITREQIAAIMHRYAQYKRYDVTQGGMLVREFDDYEAISDYALTSMTWAVNSGLLNGKGNNRLAPQDSATRAEIAAILHRFIEANK